MLKKHKLNLRKLHLQSMKNKLIIINALMSVVILFAILFQSVHSYEHLTEKLLEKKCYHQRHSNQEITHKHNSFDNCFVCQFAFSNYINISFNSNFGFIKNQILQLKTSYYKSITINIFDVNYLLRGPPFF